MGPVERRAKGKDLLRMAEALVAGRHAGRAPTATQADNPFEALDDPDAYRAWRRGFWVGRTLDEGAGVEAVMPAARQ